MKKIEKANHTKMNKGAKTLKSNNLDPNLDRKIIAHRCCQSKKTKPKYFILGSLGQQKLKNVRTTLLGNRKMLFLCSRN
jgi:hypothetical protein